MAVNLVLTVDGAAQPGMPVTATVRVVNLGSIVEAYHLRVLGTPAAWATVEQPVVRLLPGTEDSTTITFDVPSAQTLPPGALSFAVQATGETDPDDVVVEEATLDIMGVGGFAIDVMPRTARGRRGASYQVILQNLGNTDATITVSAFDPDEILECTIAKDTVRVPAGGEAVTTVKARSTEAGKGMKRFKIEALAKDGTFQSADAGLELRPLKKGIFLIPVLAVAVIAAFLLTRSGGEKGELTSAQRATSTTAAVVAGETTIAGAAGGTDTTAAAGGGGGAAGGGGGGGGAAGGGGGGGGAATTKAGAAGTPTPSFVSPTTNTTKGLSAPPPPHNATDFYARVTANGGSYATVAGFTRGVSGVSRSGVGTSSLKTNPLGSSGNVQVTAFGGNHHCNVTGWYETTINVACFSASGAPFDGSYTAVFTAATANDRWAWVNGNSVDAAYSTGGSGGGSGGNYTINFASPLSGSTTAVVTAYSTDGGVHCAVTNWGGSSVSVSCKNLANAPVSTNLSVRISNSNAVARAWVNGNGELPAEYRGNPSGGKVTAAGSTVTFEGLTWAAGGAVVASAYGSDALCSVQSFTGSTVTVSCTSQSRFSLLYL